MSTFRKKKAQANTMDTSTSQSNSNPNNGSGFNQPQHNEEHSQQQQEQREQQPKRDGASEQSPLLLQHHLHDPMLSLPPAKNNSNSGNGVRNNHNRTRSVDVNYSLPNAASESGGAESPRRAAAPGRDHHRTRSLDEWANLFGISGVSPSTGGGGETDKTTERELYDDQHRYINRSPRVSHSSKSRIIRGPKPPLPRKPPLLSLPSPSVTRNKRPLTLDRIAEAEQQDEDGSGEQQQPHQQQQESQDDDIRARDQRVAFAALAMAELRESSDSFNTLPTASAFANQARTSSYNSYNSSDYDNDNNDDNQSVDSYGSSSVSGIPRHLRTNSNGGAGDRYSFGSGGGGDASSVHDDDNNSTGSWLETLSRHSRGNSRGRSDSFDLAASERLAKFEKAQEVAFQTKRMSMERELSNVLERNAVKSHREKQEFISTYMGELEVQREQLVEQWKQEWETEEENMRLRDPKVRLLNDVYDKIGRVLDILMYYFSSAEVFISNMPLTIAALALSWVSMGCVWFKFMEENIDSCKHVHFYSPQCTFPEFPGCFQCDVENDWYILAVNFHYFCSSVSFTFCCMIMLKVIIAWDVVIDELGNPTTSTPCGVFCIAMVCVFAGRGPVGEMVVLITATFHFILAFWFLYMAIYRYRLYPDPGWFPNTVGISYAAVKSFLYFPLYGEILMGLCLVFFVCVFFVSVIRVATNPKIAAPICWFMISAPSITLYAVTLISQPIAGDAQLMAKNPETLEYFLNSLHHFYLPLHHFLFACSLVGVCSAIHGVLSRWKKFKEKAFSPAHVAFMAPTLAHANAIQSYRATIMSLSRFPEGGWFRNAIYCYWCVCLIVGTLVCFIFTYKFLRRLPEWTKVDVSGEEAPPAPYETMTHEMLDDRGAHEAMFHQTFVNPAVLEANEAGALVRVRRGTEDYRRYGPFIRTRQVTARGFDPSMNDTELREERAALLDWVAKNAPRKRNRTMSIPGVMHLRDKSGRDLYGTFFGDLAGGSSADSGDVTPASASKKHGRSKTSIDGYW